MTATPAMLNGQRVASARLFLFWKGAWIVEAALDPDVTSLAPSSGPASLSLAGQTLVGTVDPRGSGSFVDKASARIVAGAGAWDTIVPQQEFAGVGDGPVLSTQVYQATAAIIRETVVDLVPAQWPSHVERSNGPASRIFGALDWWVDFAGITNVGPRPPAVADPSLQILDFDPLEQRVAFTSEAGLLMPGTSLTDPRLNGQTLVVRDVEQVFDRDGSRGTAWCSAAPASRLANALANLVVELGGRTFVRAYRYRLVLYQGAGLALQAVSEEPGLPNIIGLPPSSGLAGCVNKLAPSQELWIAFDQTTQPPTPFILAYSLTGLPLETTVDASVAVHVGPSAVSVDLAGGLVALATAPWAQALVAALAALAGSLTTGTLASMSTGGAALTTALGALPPAATTKTKAT